MPERLSAFPLKPTTFSKFLRTWLEKGPYLPFILLLIAEIDSDCGIARQLRGLRISQREMDGLGNDDGSVGKYLREITSIK